LHMRTILSARVRCFTATQWQMVEKRKSVKVCSLTYEFYPTYNRVFMFIISGRSWVASQVHHGSECAQRG